MSTKQVHTCPDLASGSRPSMAARFKTLGRGVVIAGAVAALSLTAAPTPASAHGPGVGAAIGLGILGGVIAGAAIAAATPPVYAAPPSCYYYPQQGYYYDNTPPPAYYYAPQPYYGSAGYSYPALQLSIVAVRRRLGPPDDRSLASFAGAGFSRRIRLDPALE